MLIVVFSENMTPCANPALRRHKKSLYQQAFCFDEG
jgi:hypothetical protein